jgi:hypothetical protein
MPRMPALVPTFHAHDYVQPLAVPVLTSTAVESDKRLAAERSAAFERSAHEIADGLVRMVSDIQREGILEDNLAALRRFSTEEFLTQQSSVESLQRDILDLERMISDLRKLGGSREVKNQIRKTQELMAQTQWLRDVVSIARDAYKQCLDSLNQITPKRLSAEDYATVQAIDRVLPKLKEMQESFRAPASPPQSDSAADDDAFNLHRSVALLGAAFSGVVSLHLFGVIGGVIGSLAGSWVALRLAPLLGRD